MSRSFSPRKSSAHPADWSPGAAMSFRDHIVTCNNYDPARAVPFFAGGDRVGLLRRDNAAALRRFPDVFAVDDDRVSLLARGDVAAVRHAVDAVVDALVAAKRIPKSR